MLHAASYVGSKERPQGVKMRALACVLTPNWRPAVRRPPAARTEAHDRGRRNGTRRRFWQLHAAGEPDRDVPKPPRPSGNARRKRLPVRDAPEVAATGHPAGVKTQA